MELVPVLEALVAFSWGACGGLVVLLVRAVRAHRRGRALRVYVLDTRDPNDVLGDLALPDGEMLVLRLPDGAGTIRLVHEHAARRLWLQPGPPAELEWSP